VVAGHGGAEAGGAAERDAGELGARVGRCRGGGELVGEVGAQGQLDETLDEDAGLEPGLVGGLGEEGVARVGGVGGLEGDEEVEGRGGGVPEGFGVELDEVEGWRKGGGVC
jgi:hypothetical protein